MGVHSDPDLRVLLWFAHFSAARSSAMFAGTRQLVVPDWPMFNRNPTKWLDQLPPREGVMPVGAAAEDEG